MAKRANFHSDGQTSYFHRYDFFSNSPSSKSGVLFYSSFSSVWFFEVLSRDYPMTDISVTKLKSTKAFVYTALACRTLVIWEGISSGNLPTKEL
ncbi:hypothetical protein Ahy_B03g068203 isoform A [Arachis hypogaea]|uniref:Uncharacterized protein n=1 Tax=Arachis hypogaea TaxID=3818 RepID=A0A445A981_ARAHY|nr:hypothetical protein Ahy_B03g068203 isoform A [Arachis hypogaea]